MPRISRRYDSEQSEMSTASRVRRSSFSSSDARRGPEDDDEFEKRQSVVNQRQIQQRVSFMQPSQSFGSLPDTVSRLEMVRYLALQRWSRRLCQEGLLPLLIWVAFLTVFSTHVHTVPSFRIRSAVVDHVEGMVADLSRGVTPDRIFSSEIKQQVNCKCSCALGPTQARCDAGNTRNFPFAGRLTLQQLAQLRVRSNYNATEAAQVQQLRWQQLENLDDVWFWVQHAFVPTVWKEVARNSALNLTDYFPAALAPAGGSVDVDALDPAVPKVMLHWNQLVAGVRLRQRRLQEKPCSVGAEVAARLGRQCYGDRAAQRPYGPGMLAYAEGFVPDPSTPGAFDAFLDLQLPVTSALEKLEHTLKGYRWLDGASDSLSLQTMMFNAEASPPMLGAIEVMFFFDRSGGLRHEVSVRTTSIVQYTSAQEQILNIVWLALVAVLVIRQVLRLVLSLARKRTRQRETICDFFAMVDVATVVGSIGMVMNFFLLEAETAFVVERIAALPAAPQGVGPTSQPIRQYHEVWGTLLDQMLTLLTWGEWNRIYLFWYTMLLTFQFLASFRSQPRLALLGKVLTNAGEDLFHFVIFFLSIYLNFAAAGYMLFGSHLEEWSSVTYACHSTLQAVMGIVDLERMYRVAPLSSILWFIGMAASLIFVCLNMLVATVCDNYVTIRNRMGSVAGVLDQARFTLRDMRSRGISSTCGCRRRADPSIPSHTMLLDELMYRSGLTNQEMNTVHSSVLGASASRHELEQIAFAIVTEKAEDAQTRVFLGRKPVNNDMDELGVDADYAEALLEDCHKYLHLEYDYEEQSERQLRELVTLAEGEMHSMRQRLKECEEFTGEKMGGLGETLESFESMVHGALRDLVDVAEGANVSVKANHATAGTPMKRQAKLDGMVSRMKSLPNQMKTQTMFGSSSVKNVMEHLTTMPRDGEEPRKSLRETARLLPTLKEEARSAPTATSMFHRAMKVVNPHGKRVLVSARQHWEDK